MARAKHPSSARLIGTLPPLSGGFRLGGATKLGYMAQEQELLNPNFSALQTIQSVAPFNETEARNFLHYFLFKGDIALRPSRELSFGERARLQLGDIGRARLYLPDFG